MSKCTRSYYEGSVDIRAVKLESAEKAYADIISEIVETPKSGGRIAVVGGGPAGLSVAYFLARAGRSVTLFEKKGAPGGIVRHVIPVFRISDQVIENDVALVQAMGVDIRLNCEIGSLDELRSEGFEQIIIAVGAWKPGALELTGSHVLDAIEFLERLKSDPRSVQLGENVVVIGGGNTAMDTARAAKRVSGTKNVSLVYRRNKRYMPADGDELEHALKDGIEFCELLAPVSFENGILTCDKMKLGAPDASNRRSPEPAGESVEIPADTVISAVGNTVDGELFGRFGIPVDKRGRPVIDRETFKTGVEGVYVIGDAAGGPSTVAEAIADAAKCAFGITGGDAEGFAERYVEMNVNPDKLPGTEKKGVLNVGETPVCEPGRCLECATICENCVDVCPNRANVSILVDGRPQIVHIDSMCNECGNCETFCPYSSAPYRDKFTLFSGIDDFDDSGNAGFLPLGNGLVRVRFAGKTADYDDGTGLYAGIWKLVLSAVQRLKN